MLVTGKISQAVVVAAAAYRDTAEFCKRTGITNSQLIDDEFHTNTHVGLANCMFFAILLSCVIATAWAEAI